MGHGTLSLRASVPREREHTVRLLPSQRPWVPRRARTRTYVRTRTHGLASRAQASAPGVESSPGVYRIPTCRRAECCLEDASGARDVSKHNVQKGVDAPLDALLAASSTPLAPRSPAFCPLLLAPGS